MNIMDYVWSRIIETYNTDPGDAIFYELSKIKFNVSSIPSSINDTGSASSQPSKRRKIVKNDAKTVDQTSDIFKLTLDCLDELFEWMPINELHAFGQTCKRMQRAAGLHFQKTYKNSWIAVKSYGIYCGRHQINGFSEFIENVYISDDETMEPFQYLQTHCNKSLKKIVFRQMTPTIEQIECIKGSLNKIEFIEFNVSNIEMDLYENFFKFCPNLKKLTLNCYFDLDQNDWLHKKCPKLESIKIVNLNDEEIVGLKTFFQQNPTIKSITTDEVTFANNWKSFVESGLKLDDFKLILDECETNYDICELMKKLHDEGFYKSLHLVYSDQYEDLLEEFKAIPELMSMHINDDINNNITTLSCFKMLRTLQLHSIEDQSNNDMDVLAKGLVSLEKILFDQVSADQILPFICQSPQLREINVFIEFEDGVHCKDGVLDLVALNKERKKLSGARKLVIAVPERIFLATKWANEKTNYDKIVLRQEYTFPH